MSACPTCGAENPAEARFCPSCGSALGPACMNCGTPLAESARFCHACGHPVEEGRPGEERKLVTILFADVTGSTDLGERLDAEGLKEVMSSFFEAMRTEIEAEGGTVEKFIGDAVMAAFGVPAAHEDDPARALLAALRMRDRLRVLNDELERRRGIRLEMRVGVNTGEVIAATEPTPGEAMVTGDAVNAAARLEQSAEPGQVLVSERTARATRGFRFAELGALRLRGKGALVSALELLGRAEVTERGVPGIRAPMIGRDEELAVLRSLYERVAAEERPQLVTIYGDAGVGKSRLTAEFLGWAEQQDPGPLVVRGRCLPYGEGITYWPLAEILKGIAGVLDTDAPDLAAEKIAKLGRDVLGPDVPNAARATAALAYTVGVEVPGESFRDLAPRAVRSEVDAAWRAFFSGLSQDRPALAVIEDIHWADPAMLDLLEVLADRVQGSVLFVCPARPELTQRRSTWGGGKRNFSSMFLEPLSRADADRLIRFLLAVEDLPASVHDRMLERAEGNPFFLEEIVRHLIDEGRIVRDGDRWRAAAEIEEVVIPDTVQAVLAARIDLLDAEEKRALQSAAVVGRVFWPGPVSRLLDGDAGALDDILDRLEERELVFARVASSMADQREYIFKHILTRDVAYETIPRRDRFTAHAEVARWIEDTAGDRRGEFGELLAHHYREAHRGSEQEARRDPDAVEALRVKAVEYLLQAAEDAQSKFAVRKAIGLGNETLSVARTGIERARALEVLGQAHQLDGNGDESWRHNREAAEIRLAELADDRRAIARTCAFLVETPTRWPGSVRLRLSEADAKRYLDIGLEHAGEGDSEELARLLTAKAFWPFAYGSTREGDLDESVAAGELAADMALRLGRPDLASAALDGVASVHISTGRYDRQWPVVERRLELVEDIADPREVGDIYGVAAWGRFHVGLYREALRYADEGFRRTQSEVTASSVHLLAWRIVARCRLGQWQELHEDVALAEDLLGERRAHPPRFAHRLFAAAAFVHEVQGDGAGADGYISMIRRLAEDEGAGLLGVAGWVASLLTRRGSLAEARHVLEVNEELHSAGVNRGLRLETWCDLIAEEGRWDEASNVLGQARAESKQAGLVALRAFADRLEGRASLAGGDAGGATERLAVARRRFADLGARWEVACTDLSLAEALQAAGRSNEAGAAATSALEIFDELQAVREQARARELLAALD